MSLIHPDTHLDLIDFHVGSPVLPRRSSIPEIHFEQESENLIDTELPIFEQKLQTAPSTIGCQSRRDSIDVEDILINIDSDEYETDSLDGERVETGNFLDVCDGVTVENSNKETTLPVDNFEALLVLKNLDDLLNATLEESDDILDGNSNNYQQAIEELPGSDENTQQIIEECLEDLDNYLKAIEDDDSVSRTSSRSFSSDEQSTSRDSSSLLEFAGSSLFEEQEDSQIEFDEELARSKLRKIEQNYSKFVSSGIINRGYVDTENNANFTLGAQLRRPSSAYAAPSQQWKRKHPLRATTLAVVRKERPRLLARRKSLNENNTAPHCTLFRTSGADANCNTPENWLTSRDVTRERHAHASGDCCTGTVIVEPLHRQSKANSSSASVVNEVPPATVPKEEVRRTLRGTWLRSSMRRLQHLNLPSAESAPEENSAGSGEVDSTRLEVSTNARPVSAPSRLPPIRTSTGRSSRSRSRDSVSHEPNGRARSSSASSHSRRRRSLSSSVTSLASSVESTLSHMPPSDATRNGASVHETTTNADARRYSFLITGVLYGALKLQALKAWEASKTEEKTRKRAERNIRLVEERRLAAVRDFNQIVEIFGPPTRVGTTTDILVTDQGYNPAVQGLSTQRYETNYETIHENDIQHDTEADIPKADDPSQSDISHNISVVETADDLLTPDISYNIPVVETDTPKIDDFLTPNITDSIPVVETDIPKIDDLLTRDISHSIPVVEADIPKTDDLLQPDISPSIPEIEADIPKTDDLSQPDISQNIPVIESDISKTDDSSADRLYDRPIDFSVDDGTTSTADRGDSGDLENKTTESHGGELPAGNLDDSEYLIKDFGSIPVFPSEEEGRFPPEN